MSSACLGVLVAQSVRLHSGVPADDGGLMLIDPNFVQCSARIRVGAEGM